MRSRPLVEICVDSVDGARAAEAGGADRAELCADLPLGGTTPSAGAMRLARELCEIDLAVMIRPRAGDFLYSANELEVMRRDIDTAKEAGATAVVLGLLLPDGRIDAARTHELVARARPLQVTFHRAFDMSRDPFEALTALLDLGVDRLLTSGQRPAVDQGLELVADLVARAGDALSVMPGCGVNEDNVGRILDVTGAREIHFSARVAGESGMEFRNPACSMGTSALPGEYEIVRASTHRVRDLLAKAAAER